MPRKYKIRIQIQCQRIQQELGYMHLGSWSKLIVNKRQIYLFRASSE
jgi:hypothetical protein